jgi:hypothetical protein
LGKAGAAKSHIMAITLAAVHLRTNAIPPSDSTSMTPSFDMTQLLLLGKKLKPIPTKTAGG